MDRQQEDPERDAVLFNSVEYLLFLPLVVLAFYALPHRWRLPLLLVASYFFYMRWRPVYGLLVAGVTLVSYWCGRQIARADRLGVRKVYLWLNVGSCLGLLAYFKYANFLLDSLGALLHPLGLGEAWPVLHVILPIGISFYIFHALSYTVDIYRGTQKPADNLLEFALYIAFFPQLVAGPITRAGEVLHQFRVEQRFDWNRCYAGLRMVLWGLFMKMVVADNLSPYVDAVYNNPSMHTGPSILMATLFFSFEMYGDFAGYSWVAMGSAELIGIRLPVNFRPFYVSQSITEFWRRWHISLTRWLHDYLFMSLGGVRAGFTRTLVNLLVTFLLGGLWHGANWTFVIWGGMQGVLLIAEKFLFRLWPRLRRRQTGWAGALRTVCTFWLLCLSGAIFRANTVGDLGVLIHRLTMGWPELFRPGQRLFLALLAVFLLVGLEQLMERRRPVQWFHRHAGVRFAGYCALVMVILLIGSLGGRQFIYFQF